MTADHDYDYDLFWHALNYRTAGTREAEAMWQELLACHKRIAKKTFELSAMGMSEEWVKKSIDLLDKK